MLDFKVTDKGVTVAGECPENSNRITFYLDPAGRRQWIGEIAATGALPTSWDDQTAHWSSFNLGLAVPPTIEGNHYSVLYPHFQQKAEQMATRLISESGPTE